MTVINASRARRRMKAHATLPDSHRESVDVLVQLIQKTNCLDYHVISTIHIEFYLGTRKAMTKP